MNSVTIIFGAILLLTPLAASGQEPATTKKQALIRELLVVTDASRNAAKAINSMMGELNKQYPRMVESLVDTDPTLTPAQRERAKRTLNENNSQYSTQLMERLEQRIDIGQVIDSISASLYDKYFTEDELKDLITFYRTPTGRKTLAIMPQYLAESVQLAGEKLGPILTTLLTEMASEEKEKLKRIK